MKNDNEDYKLYVLAEITYTRENSNLKEEELFPVDWYSINDYKTKIEIMICNFDCFSFVLFITNIPLEYYIYF